MRFYRLHWTTEGGNSGGFDYFTRKDDAEREARAFMRQHGGEDGEEADVDAIDIVPTRDGILRALKWLASHADNG